MDGYLLKHLISSFVHTTTDHIYLSKMEGKAWTCDSLTISYASPRGTNRCRSCKLHMESGAIRFGMIFKCPSMSTMLFQGFHLHCVQAPSFLTSIELLEGIEDISPSDVAIIERWIATGVARGMEGCAAAAHSHQRRKTT